MSEDEGTIVQHMIDHGEHLWYVVAEHTNAYIRDGAGMPIIFTDQGRAKQIARDVDMPHVVMSVAEYNDTFSRFMEK